MELTPQLLAEVEFRDTLRGYDRDEVDTFLEQVGVAIAQLQGRLREAIERAEVAEARGTDGEGVSADTITRTLLLAQRTADATVAEAETDATRMVDDAQEAAARMRSEAEADRSAVLAETENEARQVAEQARRDLLEELRQLELDRDTIRSDVASLGTALVAERTRVLDAAEQLRTLAEGGALDTGVDLGEVTPAPEPIVDDGPTVSGADLDDDHIDLEAETTAAVEPEPEIDLSENAAVEVEDAAIDLAGDDDLVDGPADPAPGVSVFDDGDPTAGPATQAVDVLALDDEADDHDDVFVQQLREAVSPSGQGDGEAMADFFEAEDGPRRLFGRNSE